MMKLQAYGVTDNEILNIKQHTAKWSCSSAQIKLAKIDSNYQSLLKPLYRKFSI